MDKIDKIIETAIAYTDDVLSCNPDLYTVSREGLERLREALYAKDKSNEAILKLDDYLNELRRRFSN